MKRPGLLAEYGALVALVLLFIINVITRGSNFLQVENLRNLISQDAGVGVIAIGMTLVIIAGGIDLSVGSMTAMCGAAAILAVNKVAASGMGGGMAVLVAALVAILVGTLAGFFNGLVVAYGRVASFVVTLGGLAGFRSIALVLGDGGEIRSQVQSLEDFGLGGVPIPFVKNASGGPVQLYWSAVIFIIVAVLFGFILNKTRLGRYIIAVGANAKASEYSGINIQTIRLTVFTLLGALVGLASVLVGARMNSVGTGSVGLYYELDAIAAVVIGGTSLRGGSGRIWGTVVGVLLLTLISNMITAYHIDTNWQGLVRGVVILIAVLIQRGKKEDD
ncbi:MAG TPA: ABC transporter permease [Fimbriimonas sp.]|nr:ABC transporter permease [Fimbriimonas sp.]